MIRSRLFLLVTLLTVAGCEDGPFFAAPPPGPIDLAAPWESAAALGVGIDPASLSDAAREAASIRRMRSLLVVRRGRLVHEEYFGGTTPETPADVRSVTKTLVGTLAGLAHADGAISSLDQPITDFLTAPEYPVTAAHAAVTVRHLLTMSAGFEWREFSHNEYNDWIFSDDHVGYLLDQPFTSPPGSVFNYNSAAVHLLGLVIEEAVGAALPAYASERLFGPLGIDDVQWEDLLDGQVNGGSGIDLRPRDLARFGQLFAQGGRSGEQRILPEGWVAEATAPRWPGLGRTSEIDDLSYGYLWWVDRTHGAFFAWGYAGQFIYVDPDLELVVVATTDWVEVSQDIGSSRLQQEVLSIVLGTIVPGVSE